ncbi:hypothetical protein E2C01_031662 [Portunus trituberculatus]|uniref:Uncharacterized protein n=1 Tax=Portunus trituberculatus TaxID=210409 RepID=A0A5B7EYR0_PORTR|nr:hypothetical protein [Portunus trituberculatus]
MNGKVVFGDNNPGTSLPGVTSSDEGKEEDMRGAASGSGGDVIDGVQVSVLRGLVEGLSVGDNRHIQAEESLQGAVGEFLVEVNSPVCTMCAGSVPDGLCVVMDNERPDGVAVSMKAERAGGLRLRALVVGSKGCKFVSCYQECKA